METESMSPQQTRTPASSAGAGGGGDDFRGDMKLLTYKVDELTRKFDKFSDEIKTTYASKTEVAELRDDVHGIKGNITWLLRLVIGLIVAAVIGLVIVKGGTPR
jgi:hypothetical protein